MKCAKCSIFYYSKEICPRCGCSPVDSKIVFDPAILDLATIGRSFSRHGYYIEEAALNDIPVLSLRHENKDFPNILIGFIKSEHSKADLIIALIVPVAEIECIQSYLDQLNKINSAVSPFKFVINNPKELIALAVFPMFSRVISCDLVYKVELEINCVCQSIADNLGDYLEDRPQKRFQK